MIPNWILRLAGKYVAKKINLQEGTMDNTKAWFQSKTVWAGIYATLRALYTVVGQVLLPAFGKPPLPPIPPVVDGIVGSVVGSVVVYGRMTADSKIG